MAIKLKNIEAYQDKIPTAAAIWNDVCVAAGLIDDDQNVNRLSGIYQDIPRIWGSNKNRLRTIKRWADALVETVASGEIDDTTNNSFDAIARLVANNLNMSEEDAESYLALAICRAAGNINNYWNDVETSAGVNARNEYLGNAIYEYGLWATQLIDDTSRLNQPASVNASTQATTTTSQQPQAAAQQTKATKAGARSTTAKPTVKASGNYSSTGKTNAAGYDIVVDVNGNEKVILPSGKLVSPSSFYAKGPMSSKCKSIKNPGNKTILTAGSDKLYVIKNLAATETSDKYASVDPYKDRQSTKSQLVVAKSHSLSHTKVFFKSEAEAKAALDNLAPKYSGANLEVHTITKISPDGYFEVDTDQGLVYISAAKLNEMFKQYEALMAERYSKLIDENNHIIKKHRAWDDYSESYKEYLSDAYTKIK